MRCVQPQGTRGSLKWIQQAIEHRWNGLEQPILDHTGAGNIEWRSPIASDEFAEYRDGAFLKLLGHDALVPQLAEFWPSRGPQWDALGVTDTGQTLLIEAKAHVDEMCSPATGASPESRKLIEKRLGETAAALGARKGHADWAEFFYQLGNRIAHLHWLRAQGLDAWLVLVNFLNDRTMKGPSTSEAWLAAYKVAWYVMGLPKRHALSSYIIEIFPDVESPNRRNRQ